MYWILFPIKNRKLMPAKCDWVTQCLGSLTFSLVSALSTIRSKRIMDHTRIHNIAQVICHTCTYFFPKQNDFVERLHTFMTMFCLSFFCQIFKRVFKNTIFYVKSIIQLLFFRNSHSQMFYRCS